jgi:hypothetical protein
MRLELALDHADDQIVGNELAAVHVALRLDPERRPRAAVRAQDVAGRDLPVAEALLEHLRLRAFARTRRTEEDEVHRLMNPR